MTQLRTMAIVVFFIICVNQALAQDWKAQPNPNVTGQVRMNLLSGSGCRILNGFSGETDGDKWGVLGTYEVITPTFSKAVFYAHATKAKAWPNMRNQAYPYIITNNKESIAELRDGVVFFILELKEGGYLAVTAMPGPETESWLHTDKKGRLLLSFGTFGTDGVKNCDVPLFAWARSDDIYEACSKTINSAISSKPILNWAHLRHEKEYPEVFEYLGWCSWEHFKGKINEQNMLQSIDEIEASNLPIRYIIIDMGHTSSKRGALTTFKPNPDPMDVPMAFFPGRSGGD
ncbi:MAG: Sip1-related alpha-galactosidase [Planctomycetota bacterium]